MSRTVITWMRRPAFRPAVIVLMLLAAGAVAVQGFRRTEPVVATIALGQPIGSSAMVVDSRTHRAFVATMTTAAAAPPTSRINVLDTHTGALLPPVVVGINLLPLVLDDRHDHVVVATSTLANTGIVRLLDGPCDASNVTLE